MEQANHQLPLVLGGAPSAAPLRIKRKANRRLPAAQHPPLPLKEKRYLPVVGVPETRQDCPTSTACTHVRCRYHLWRIDTCDRPGRPGLASVPRDEYGRTIAVRGDRGSERAGTTLWPAWLELERTCKVVLVRDDDGRITHADTYTSMTEPVGTWELFRRHTHDGEPLEVLNEEGKLCGAATLTPEGIRFRHLIGGYVVTLRRMRGVPSCALDEADKGPRTNTQIGDARGKHRTLAARDVKSALASYIEAGGTLEGLRALAREMEGRVSLDGNR